MTRLSCCGSFDAKGMEPLIGPDAGYANTRPMHLQSGLFASPPGTDMIKFKRMEDDDFEWDDFKAARNLAIHGVSFEAARLAFDDPFAMAREDRRWDYGERRYILLGMVQSPACDHIRGARSARAYYFRPSSGAAGTATVS